MAFNDLSLDELKRIQDAVYEVVTQVGKLVIQDYEALLVLLPTALADEIKVVGKQPKFKVGDIVYNNLSYLKRELLVLEVCETIEPDVVEEGYDYLYKVENNNCTIEFLFEGDLDYERIQ